MSLNYKNGDCLQESNERRIIAHVCNDKGGFGAGFALSVAQRYPTVKEAYRRWYQDTKIYNITNFKLGEIQRVFVSLDLSFVNMICQVGYRSSSNSIPLDYNALELCLKKLKAVNKGELPIWMPAIGSGLSGGDWNQIEVLINNVLDEEEVIIWKL